MLRRGDIAQEGRAAHGGNRPADGRGDVVVPRGDVRHQGAQHIEGRPHADALLHLHVGRHLVQGHMAGALHHHLDVVLPGPLGQLAQTHQLLNLAHVGGVGQAAGPAGIPQRDGHVVLFADVQNLVEVLVEGVFLPGHGHPGEHQAAAPADNVHLPLVAADLVNGLAGDAAVQGDKVHPVLRVKAHHVDEVLGGEGAQVPLVVDDAVVHRHGADHGGALGHQLFPEGLGVPVGGQVHDGLGPQVDGALHLFHLDVIVLAVPGDPQVHVDLGAQHAAHALGVQAGVGLVGADGHLAFCHQLHQPLQRHVFLLRHGLHLWGGNALAGGVHLGGVFHRSVLLVGSQWIGVV